MSVGIIPSCRTLVVGSIHRVFDVKLQFPFSEDPFTDDMIGAPSGYKYNLGKTIIRRIIQSC